MKNNFKRILSLILAMIMVTLPLVSGAQEVIDSELDLMSLFPLDEVRAHVNLAEIPLEKLPQMTARELFGYLRADNTNELIEVDAASASVWTNFLNEDGEYIYDTWKVIGFDEPINVLEQCIENNYDIEVIIGSGNQLDAGNVRYFIDFKLPRGSAYLEFKGYIYDELYDVTVGEILSNIPNFKIKDKKSVEILWNVKEFLECGYDFGYDDINGWIKLDYDDSIKLAPTPEEFYAHNAWWNRYLEMIIKFDNTTVMCHLNTSLPEYTDMFEYSIYTQDDSGKRKIVEIDNVFGNRLKRRVNGEDVYCYGMHLEVKSYNSYDDAYYLGMKLNKNYEKCQLKVFKGWEYDKDEIKSWIVDGKAPEGVDITEEIVAQDMSHTDAGLKDYWLKNGGQEVMICVMLNNDIYVIPVWLIMTLTSDNIDIDGLFADVDGRRVQVCTAIDVEYEEEKVNNEWYYTSEITCYLGKDFKTDEEYSLGMMFYDGDLHTSNASKVDKAVVGHYYSLEEAETLPDIKEQLFAEEIYEPENGYKADFSGDGVEFTVFANDEIYHFRVKTKEAYYEETPDYDDEHDEAPQVGMQDKYFRVADLYNGDDWLDTYVVPYEYDTYYSYGYQTILINEDEADMSAISPKVVLGDQVKVYYGDTMENTNNDYYNKLEPRDFTKTPLDTTRDPYSSVRYTASTQDHANQKNYWITAVKKEEGAKLFVNGPDEREIFLNNYFGNVHDIFIANIGSEELTGLTATIDAVNVKLDDYWTVGGEGNNTLAPFTTSNAAGSGKGDLFNIAKIRLVPDGEGEIEGTLTISADGQEPRVITLRGTAGNPKIDTSVIHDAVKYVPYSSIITTNNMHDWNKVTFSVWDGNLPAGLTLYPNGEIYGVPKETGEFPVTIKAQYSHGEFEPSYAEIVITVKENSDANINASVDDGYEITTKLPAVISDTAISDMEFVIDGEFSEFMDLWLDGDKLAREIDYTAISGSTKITIKSKTISNAGKGKHTISAEFRVGGDKNGELKTASQNFTVGSAPATSGGGGGGGVPAYVISFKTNGGNALNNKAIRKGNKVYDLPTPTKEGYVFAGWFNDEALTQPFDPSVAITSHVKLYAKWDTEAPEEVPVETSEFADVKADDWFFEDVQWAYANNVMIGYSDEKFAPEETITNSMVVTVLARLAGADISIYENKKLEDVADGQWYTPYANWAKDVGIADDISFTEPSEITREMMGVVLFRFLEYMEKECDVPEKFAEFKDKDLISDKAMNAIQALYKLGIIKGKENNTIDPLGNTNRAEFAALIHRVYALINK